MRSDDEETAQTVSYMDQIAADESSHPAIRNAATEALEDAALTPNASDPDKANAVFWWLKRNVRYVSVPGTNPLVDQTLIAPTALLAMPEPIGDCAQFAMLAAAMFRVLCMECRFVTIAAERLQPDQWSHVYNTVEIFPGAFMPFDASNGPEPGAEYARPFKRRTWPKLNPGKCVSKEGAATMMRGNYGSPRGMRNAALRTALRGTLGDDTTGYDPTIDYSTLTPPAVPTLTTAQIDASYQPDLAYEEAAANQTIANMAPGAITTPSANANPLNTLITDAASVATKALQTSAKPYYITGPSGQQVLYNPATGTAVSSGLSSISPTMLGAGLLILGLMAFAGKK